MAIDRDAIERGAPALEVNLVGAVPNLFIAPSRIALAKLESKLIGELDGPFRLKDKMVAAATEYDYIFIDTPPTLGMITVNALVASTHVLQSNWAARRGSRVRVHPGRRRGDRPLPL